MKNYDELMNEASDQATDTRDYLTREGYDPTCGARPLKQLIQKEIQDVLALKLLTGEFIEGQTVEVEAGNGGLVFSAMTALNSADAVEEKEKA